jgi:glycosyltransferase involved in cell wall biosynthesis
MTESQRPLRLALVSPDYPPDPKGTGIGTYTKLLAEYLSERGHTVHVLTRGEEDSSEQQNGVSLHRIGVARPDIPYRLELFTVARLALTSFASEFHYRRKIAAKLEQLIVSEHLDLVESAESFAETLLFPARRYPNLPFIVKLHTPLAVGELFDKNLPEPARRLVRAFERRLILKASHLSVPSRAGRALFRREMSLGNRPIHLLYNPPPRYLDTPYLNTPTEDMPPAQPPEVLFVGRLTLFKGTQLLIQAVPKVLAQVEAKFIFVGADASNAQGYGSSAAMLRDKLPASCQQAVEFRGHVRLERLGAIYRRASVFVLPSLFDNFPYTCLEAMHCGKAIVSSSSGGMRELLTGCGLFFNPPDVETLSQHIVTLLRDPALREKLGQAARQRLEEHFAKEVIMEETEAFYRRALSEMSEKPPAAGPEALD